MPFYGDFNKKSKDLFSKEFVSDVKLKIEDQASKDSPKLTVNLAKKGDAGKIAGDYELKFNVPYADVKAKANTEGVVFVEVESKNFGVAGLVVTEKIDSDKNVEVNVEYSNNGVFAKAAFVPNTSVKASLTSGHGDFSGGVEAALNLAKGTRQFDGAVAYTRSDNVITAGTRSGGNEVFFSYYRRVPAQNLQVAAEVAIQAANLNSPSVTVGLEQAYDNNFTYKLKLDAAKLDLHAVAIHKLRSNVTLNTGASVNLTTLAPKVGFGLTISN